MLHRFLGNTGLKVSRLGLGTMTWGAGTDEHEAAEVLRAFVGAGGTLVDTAASYGGAASEEILGSLLGSVVDRDDIVLATKGGITRDTGQRIVDVSRRALMRDLDTSLERLGVDHVDLWQIHTWSPEVALDESLSALELAVASGRARYVGISNYSGWQTALAATLRRDSPSGATIASTQVEYSLLQRGVEREVVPAALALGIGLLPWSPLGGGVLTGKYRDALPADSRAAAGPFEGFVGRRLTPESGRVVEAVSRAADGLELSPTQVALAWVRDQPGVTAPIVGARTADQLRASLTVEDVTLPDEITAALDDVSAPELGYPET